MSLAQICENLYRIALKQAWRACLAICGFAGDFDLRGIISHKLVVTRACAATARDRMSVENSLSGEETCGQRQTEFLPF